MSNDLAAAIARHGLRVTSVFVPFSQSRNAANDPGTKPNLRSLNWRVTLHKDGTGETAGTHEILSCDYSAGVGHCPSYRQGARWTLDYAAAIVAETESGRVAGPSAAKRGKKIEPSAVDVIASLLLEASAIDYPAYEGWADDLGYDRDSRKGEAAYRECLATALKLRAALGDAALSELRDAAAGW